jgi:RNA polymerase sigma factor (TIGR02999 family)
MDDDPGQVTLLLRQLDEGDPKALDQLLPIVYQELHHVAHQLMRRQAPEHTLQPTALVNEAFLKLFRTKIGTSFEDHRHFIRKAGRAMRDILIDHARTGRSLKRGGIARQLPLNDVLAELKSSPGISAVNEALESLTEMDPELAQVVDLRFFAGLSNEECGAVLGFSAPTIVRRWRTARAWLRNALAGDEEN